MTDDEYELSPEELEAMLAAHAVWLRAKRWADPVLPECEMDDPKTYLRNLILGEGTS